MPTHIFTEQVELPGRCASLFLCFWFYLSKKACFLNCVQTKNGGIQVSDCWFDIFVTLVASKWTALAKSLWPRLDDEG